MGTNVSKTVSDITNSVNNSVSQSSSANATAQCSIANGNIILKNANGCSVVNQNKCGVSAAAALDATVNAALAAYNDATTTQKANALPGVNVNSTRTDIKNAITTKLNQMCSAGSSTQQSILNKDIILDGCTNSNVQNINFGDATSTCGIRAVMQAAAEADATSTTTQKTSSLTELLGFDPAEYSLYISGGSLLSCISSCICCIMCIFIMMLPFIF